MENEKEKVIFISYATQNKDKAESILKNLEKAGLSCWIAPRDVLPGTKFAASITHAIKQSKLMILLLTEESNKSDHIINEIDIAVENKIKILAIRVGDFKLSNSLRYYVQTSQWMNPQGKELFDPKWLSTLVQLVLQLLYQQNHESTFEPLLLPPRKKRWRVYAGSIIVLGIMVGLLIWIYIGILASKQVSDSNNVRLLPEPNTGVNEYKTIVNITDQNDASIFVRKNTKKEGVVVLPFIVMGEMQEFGSETGDILCDALISEIDPNRYEPCKLSVIIEQTEKIGLYKSIAADSTDSAAKLGNIIGVRYAILAFVARLGDQFYLSGRVVDCANAEICKRYNSAFNSFSQWPQKIQDMAFSLSFGNTTSITTEQYKIPNNNPQANNRLINTVNSASSFTVKIKTAEDKQTYLEGEFIRFIVSSEKDCYITMITVDSKGDMTLLLPNPWHKIAFLNANQKIMIPSEQMGFHFPIKPPHGETLVKVLATEQPLRLSGVDVIKTNAMELITLTPDVGAIGTDVGQSESIEKPSQITKQLSELFEPNQWATDELVIMTAPIIP